jgi:hypothetical protein
MAAAKKYDDSATSSTTRAYERAVCSYCTKNGASASSRPAISPGRRPNSRLPSNAVTGAARPASATVMLRTAASLEPNTRTQKCSST